MVPHVDFNEDATDGEGIESETECYDYESDSDIDDCDSEPEGDVEEVEATQSPQSSDEDTITDGSDVSSFPIVVKKRSKGASMPKKLHLVGPQYKYRIVIPNMAAKT